METFAGRWHVRRAAQADLLSVVDRLVDEFPERPAGAIIRGVALVREGLLRAGNFNSLPATGERRVREQLRAESHPAAASAPQLYDRRRAERRRNTSPAFSPSGGIRGASPAAL